MPLIIGFILLAVGSYWIAHKLTQKKDPSANEESVTKKSRFIDVIKGENNKDAEETGGDCEGKTQQGLLQEIKTRGFIRLGVQKNAPPMNDVVNGKRVGFDYEMMEMIAKKLGLTKNILVEVEETETYEDIPCLLKRKRNGRYVADMIMSGLTVDYGIDDVAWTTPYLENFGYCLLSKKDMPISDLKDLKRAKIGVVEGDDVVMDYVKEKLPNAEIVELADEDLWLRAINEGKVVAIIYDYPFAVEEVKDFPNYEIKKAFLEGSDSKYSIGIPNGNDDLLAKINGIIETLKETPEYAELVRKYLASNKVKAVNTNGEKTHKVKKSESLSQIAREHLKDLNRWEEIFKMNNLGNPNLIFEGQLLVVPSDYK